MLGAAPGGSVLRRGPQQGTRDARRAGCSGPGVGMSGDQSRASALEPGCPASPGHVPLWPGLSTARPPQIPGAAPDPAVICFRLWAPRSCAGPATSGLSGLSSGFVGGASSTTSGSNPQLSGVGKLSLHPGRSQSGSHGQQLRPPRGLAANAGLGSLRRLSWGFWWGHLALGVQVLRHLSVMGAAAFRVGSLRRGEFGVPRKILRLHSLPLAP